MNTFISFDELAIDTRNKIIEFGTTARSVLETYDRVVRNLKPIMDDLSVVFCLDAALIYLNGLQRSDKKDYVRALFQATRRSILLLNDNFHGELTQYKIYHTKAKLLPKLERNLCILEQYHQYLVEQRYAKNTFNFKMYAAKHLLIYLEERDINLFDCDALTISNYCASEHFENRKPGGVAGEYIRLRHFLIYLIDTQHINRKSVVEAVPTKNVQGERKVTIMKPEDVSVLLSDFPNSPSNLRDKAIILLGIDCGLRRVDIRNLTIPDIDFDRQRVTVIQSKTKVPHTIPLSTEASNAIIDYLRYERRECNLSNLFISSYGPIRPLDPTMNVAGRFSNQENKPEQLGTQILRRTFASRLLNSGVELQVISSALGHTDKDIVHKYLSVDSVSMKRCALEVDEFPFVNGEF